MLADIIKMLAYLVKRLPRLTFALEARLEKSLITGADVADNQSTTLDQIRSNQIM